MASVLKIGGATVDRRASRIVLERLHLQVDDGYDSLEFTEVATSLPGLFGGRDPVELTVDGVVAFRGEVVSSHPGGVGSGPISIGYRAMGLEWLANRIPVTAPDGTGRIAYNLPPTDLDHMEADAGLSVGAILKRLFDLHAAELAAAGVGAYDPAELAALDVVPPEAVELSGGLWNAVRGLLRRWCNKYVPWIEPADGSIAIRSQLGGLTPLLLTLDADPITVDGLSRDHSECCTRAVVRGGPDVEAAYLDFADGGLAKGWTPEQEADHDESDFTQPKDAADLGAISGMTSTTLTVESDDAAKAWPANHWSDVVAEVVAYNPAAAGITFSESRRVTACTAMTAGGTATLTVDLPFNNSGYTRYSIRGLYSPRALVWRRLNIANQYVARRLVKRFGRAVRWSPVDGAAVMTTSPQAVICWSDGCSKPWNEFPLTFDVVPYDGTTDGHIVFHSPINRVWNAEPCDVKVLVPYSRGALSVAAPASGFEGTAHAEDGVERTLPIEIPGWLDRRDLESYRKLAQEQLDCVKNTVCEGSITYGGKLTAALAKGAAVNLARVGGTTGYEGMDALARAVVLDWLPTSPDGARWVTRVAFSNRMKPFAGDRLYIPPAWGSQAALAGASLAMPAPKPEPADGGRESGASFAPGFGGRPEPAPRNRYRKPGKDTGLSAADRRRVRGEDKEYNAMQADDRENRRRVAERGSRRHAGALAGSLGKDWVKNADERIAREGARRSAEAGSRRHAARLSTALGNPHGEGSSRADRETDAMLKALADGDDEPRRRRPGGSGFALGYR